jgi:hypothetical protein
MKTLAKILGNETRVKMMRLFIFNPEAVYTNEEIMERIRAEKNEVKKETENLQSAHFLKRVAVPSEVPGRKNKETAWSLNPLFTYRDQFQTLLTSTILLKEEDIIERLSKAGKLRLVVVAGIFIGRWDSRVDILVVGDKLKEEIIQSTISKIESEIGKELSYAAMATEDFQYRKGVGDRLVRDILDYPHNTILDKFGL